MYEDDLVVPVRVEIHRDHLGTRGEDLRVIPSGRLRDSEEDVLRLELFRGRQVRRVDLVVQRVAAEYRHPEAHVEGPVAGVRDADLLSAVLPIEITDEELQSAKLPTELRG